MERYTFDEHTRAAYERSVVPMGVYQVVDGHVVTLIASDGLCDLFGYRSRAEAVEKMDGNMYWNVHPDDAKRVVEVAAGFIQEDKPYNLVCRVMTDRGYRFIHTRGKHVTMPTGERLAVVWYIDEGAVVVDAVTAGQEEKIESLKSSLQSLLSSIPAMYFSKNVETGRYLACNQLFASYAHRESPAQVVGLTDHEIFDAETADHFAADDRMALSMDEPYTFYEDVPDAVGAPRRFQTTKLRFIDELGRPCLLGMCVDVTANNVRKRESVAIREDADKIEEERASFARINALTGDYLSIYAVDLHTGYYVEYDASHRVRALDIPPRGDDFFNVYRSSTARHIHPDDLNMFLSLFTGENVIRSARSSGVFALEYRLMVGDEPLYVCFKAALRPGDRQMYVGLVNIDALKKREEDYARKLSAARSMVTVDSLTGVKNKHAYIQWEEKINAAIARGDQEPFAAVVCDVNNLKDVNDLYGHKEGDVCIKRACAEICSVFSHSPVFRIGGDEFAVLLTGEDYARRHKLMARITTLPRDADKAHLGDTIAAGMAEYAREQHDSLSRVPEDADKAMYRAKQQMKEALHQESRPADAAPAPEELPVPGVRKHILIADDTDSNREILGDLLREDYDILYAADGAEALEILHSHRDEISLVLLDLYMPRVSGREVITQMHLDEDLASIPVIVITVDQKAELDCLKIGAMDFIPKPYPDIEIVKTRIDKCIELSEDRDLIRHTERDKLTGLLNQDYFYRYVSRLDHIYKETTLDAVVCDVNRFHAANKQYGRQFGDHVLHTIGTAIRKLARQTGGISCRQIGDTFLLYCPHRDDYDTLLPDFAARVTAEKEIADRISLRFGVFAHAQEEPDVEERFVRAQIAADRVKDDPDRLCDFYDGN